MITEHPQPAASLTDASLRALVVDLAPLARDAGLHVEHHEAPDWTWPERATSGAEGESR